MRPILLPLLVWLLLSPIVIHAQHLQRRAIWGAQCRPALDSILAINKLPGTQALLVDRVNAGGTFELAGLQPGDLLLEINGTRLTSGAVLTEVTKATPAGETVVIKWVRSGKKFEKKVIVAALPFERGDIETKVEYGEVPFQNGWLRSIFKYPSKPGPHPTVFFMMGYNCGSVDNLPPYHPYSILMDSMLKAGFAVYRIEKPGVGDGPHPCQCAETGFDTELDVFAAGYADMLKKPQVNQDKVVMFGHSMGGIQAPLLAERPGIKPAGIAVYGTAFQSWFEYIIAMCRFQFPRNGLDYNEFEQDMRQYIDLFHAHYVQMKPLEEILQNPNWKDLLIRDFELNEAGDLLWRRWYYWQELAKKDPVIAWAGVDAKVLALYGGSDFEVFSPFNMSEIVRIVNHYHPGNGKFVELGGTDHMMISVGDMEHALAMRGTLEYRDAYMNKFDRRILKELIQWMKEI